MNYGAMKLRSTFARRGPEDTFEQWALNRFGKYLYEVFFKVYTEKTWGVPYTELSADFADKGRYDAVFSYHVKRARKAGIGVWAEEKPAEEPEPEQEGDTGAEEAT